MDDVDCVVVGAGVVGLAVARACAMAGHETILLEAESAIGTATSSRNSEVVHAGIYYPAGSLKARFCVQGRQALYAYCESHAVPHWHCGKLIVATDEGQIDNLRSLAAHASANGVDDLQWLDAAQAGREEPALRCVAALRSPSTGVVDSHAFMQSLLGDFERAGGMLALCSPVLSGRADAEGLVLRVGGAESVEIRARHVINSAGLEATSVAAQISGMPAPLVPRMRLAKGNYFALSGTSPFSHLIYPIPVRGGLGVHLTLDLGRRARFGPDVERVDRIEYAVDPHRAESFYASIRRYWPDLPDDALHPDYAGIRPKIETASASDADFVIQGPRDHGVAGLVNLFGIESPGLTSSLALADAVLHQMEVHP